MSDPNPGHGLPVHRIEALTDGIYAVAMTLLVIELKLPEHSQLHNAADLHQALANLLPKILAWVISFFVLGFFWFGHQRVFSHVRRGDGKLAALNIAQLALVSLMPFSCALIGEHGRELVSQVIYSSNMAALSVVALLTSRYVHRHPDSVLMAMSEPLYRGARLRLLGLLLISVMAVGVNWIAPTFGNTAFMLMALIMPLSRRVERASGPAEPGRAPG